MRFGLLAGFVGLLAVSCISMGGCASGDGGDDDASSLRDQSAKEPGGFAPASASVPKDGTYELRVVSASRVRLGFRDDATIKAVLTDREGEPVVDMPVSFALIGRPQDASLGQISVPTDAYGMAKTVIMAGEKAAAFAVRVSAPGAYEQLVDVAISDVGFGNLTVRAMYSGPRTVSERVVVIKADARCKELAVDRAGDAMMRLPMGEQDVQFLALPGSIDYAVLGYAQGADGTILAQGCLDGVTVLADLTTTVSIPFSDEPISVDGELALHADLDATEATESLIKTARNAANAVVLNDANGRPVQLNGEARFLLDSLDAILRSDDFVQRAGILTVADALSQARLANSGAGSLDESLQAMLTSRDEGAVGAIGELGELARPALEQIGLDARMTVEPDGMEVLLGLLTTRLSATGVDGVPPVVLDLPLDEKPLKASAVLEGDQDRLALEPSELKVAFGALAAQVLRRVLSTEQLGRGAQLRTRIGCGSLEDWLNARPLPETAACDESCAQAACERAVARILGAAETALLGLDDLRPTITLEGPFDLGDDDGDLQAEHMSSDALSGTWTAGTAELPSGDALTGTATVSAIDPKAEMAAPAR